jgi:hypothetical protein
MRLLCALRYVLGTVFVCLEYYDIQQTFGPWGAVKDNFHCILFAINSIMLFWVFPSLKIALYPLIHIEQLTNSMDLSSAWKDNNLR